MNFNELVDELLARGTDYLDEDASSLARAQRWINQAYQDILGLHAWPFVTTFIVGATDAGTVTAADLRRILFVTVVSAGATEPSDTPLDRVLIEDLVRDGIDLTLTGTPEVYYVEAGVVKSYPLGGTLRLDYIKRVPPMTGTNEPVFDSQYHNIIVDKAMVLAYKDNDNFEAATTLQTMLDADLRSMAEDYQLWARQVTYLDPTGSDL